MSASLDVPGRVLLSTFARSFLIQGSWNFRTMIGMGFAFAILPAIRRLYASDPEELAAAAQRHAEHFNAHPYLSSVALGAAVRMEAEGVDPDTVRRFKIAVRGPLGGLGDALVWATLLPMLSMAALAAYWLGAPGWTAALGFLLLYNVAHLSIRIWGFRVGLEEGQRVGRRLASAGLWDWIARLRRVAALVLGLLLGVVLGGRAGLAEAGAHWVALGGVGVLAGLLAGHHAWRPAAALMVLVVLSLAAWGGIR